MKSNEDTKIIFVGHGQSGKTRISGLFSSILGCTFKDSSEAMLFQIEGWLYDHHGLEYRTHSEMKADRFDHREKWAAAVESYCASNGGSAVADLIYCKHRIYSGCRKEQEYFSIREKYRPLSVWIDRKSAKRTPDLTIERHQCDVTLKNSGPWSHTVLRAMTLIRNFNLDGSHEIGRY